MKNCTSPCFALHKVYFCKFSSFYSELDKLFQTKYKTYSRGTLNVHEMYMFQQ